MFFYFNTKTRLVMAGFLFVLGVFVLLQGFILDQENIPLAHGSSDDNLRGWGWSEGIGWISMNCYNDYLMCEGGVNNGKPCLTNADCSGGVCKQDGTFENYCNKCYGGTNDGLACTTDVDCPSGACGKDYGVNFNTTSNKLTGWAWSEGAGWICFGETCTPPGKCTGGGNDGTTCTTDANCTQGGVCWKEICAGGDNDGAVCTTEADCPGGICQNRSPHGRTQWACVGMPTWTTETTYTCSGDGDDLSIDTEGFNNANNLVSWWEMNDSISDDVTSDTIGINDNGALKPIGASVKQVKGKRKYALEFDGSDDYVEVADSTDISITGDLTVEAWVKRGAAGTEQTIVGKWDESGAFRSYRLWFDTSNNLNFSISSDGTAVTTITQAPRCVADSTAQEITECTLDSQCSSNVCRNKPITDLRKWHHVAGKYTAGQSLKIFVDGQLAALPLTAGVPASLQDLGGKLYIGAKNTSTGLNTHFNGVIDNVSIWNRAKTGNEIFDNAHIEVSGWAKAVSSKEGGWLSLRGYTRGDKVWGSYLKDYLGFYTLGGFMGERSNNERMSTTNLVGHWKFNEHEDAWDGVGTDAIDGSGSNNHGTAQGEVTTIDKGIFSRAGDFDGGVCIGGSNPGTACTSNAQCTGGGLCGNGDYISVVDSPTLDITSELSISLWFRADSSSGAELICKSMSDADENYRLYVNPGTNTVKFDYGNATEYAETTAFTINTDEWYHVVGVFFGPGSAGKIYINGAEAGSYIAQNVRAIPPAANISPLEIGGCTPFSRYFDGMIDNVALINTGLLPGQISSMYEKRNPYSAGWGDFDDDPPVPLAFNTLTTDSSASCTQLSVQWEPSTWADSYSYWRKQQSSSTCSACSSSGCTGYTEYSYLDTCLAECSLSDTGLTENTGYCYSVEAHNETGDTFITNSSPSNPAPQWKSTTLCVPGSKGESLSINASVCGQLTLTWERTMVCSGGTQDGQDCTTSSTDCTNGGGTCIADPSVDGYNTYRALTSTGCDTSINTSTCEAVGHVGEALDYDANNDGTTDLVGHWKMNESSGTTVTDSSGSSNTGTVTDSAGASDAGAITLSVTTSGLFSNARGFDGLDDYIDLPNILDPGATDFTIELWFKPNDYTAKTEDQYIIVQEDDAATGIGRPWLLIRNSNAGTANDTVASSLGGLNTYTDTSVAPTVGSWHHAALTKSGTTIKIYINGELKVPGTQTTEASDGRLRIGLSKANTGAFDGVIDNISIYNIAKTAEQIRVDYEAGKCTAGTCSGGLGTTGVVCHQVNENDGLCGKIQTDNTACCFTDKRIVPFTDYYYKLTATNTAGESLGSSTLSGQTSCYPAPEAGEE